MYKHLIYSLIAFSPSFLLSAEVYEDALAYAFLEENSEDFLSDQDVVNNDVGLQEKPAAATKTRAQKETKPRSTKDCLPDIQPCQLNIGHIEGKGIGYDQGYTTLEAFFAPSIGKYIPFFDVKGHVFDNGKFATNLGIGLRYVWQPHKYLFGVNAYYDYRDTKHGHYNQFGAGLETFMDRWEFRANGYLPVGSKHFGYDKELTGVSFKRFQGNHILINEHYNEKVEFAMKGFNAEIGVHPLKPMPEYDLYVAAGTYYFIGRYGENTWGGKLRVAAKVLKYLSLEVSDSFDRVFHNRLQGQIILTWPFGNKKLRPRRSLNPNSCYSDNVMYARGSQPVQRQDIVVVNRIKDHAFTVDPIAINPATNQPYFVVFSDNTNPNLGDGTFENPFQNLSTGDNATNAQDASIAGNSVYVFAGDGTFAHRENGFVLKDDQRLLGSGTAHVYQTTKGTLVIPAQTAGMPHVAYPLNTMTPQNGIIVADGSEVSGLYISLNTLSYVSNNGFCIYLNGLTRGATITNNICFNDRFGIGTLITSLTPIQGSYVISNNNCSNHSGLPGGAGQGFGIYLESSNGYNVISNNVCNDIMPFATGDATGTGIFIAARSSPNNYFCNIVNNQTNHNSAQGLEVTMPSVVDAIPHTGSICVHMSGNTANENPRGIFIDSQLPPTSPVSRLIVENNSAYWNTPNSTTKGGIQVGTNNGGTLCARVKNNISTVQPSAIGAGFEFGSSGMMGHLFLLESSYTDNMGSINLSGGANAPAIVAPGTCDCQ